MSYEPMSTGISFAADVNQAELLRRDRIASSLSLGLAGITGLYVLFITVQVIVFWQRIATNDKGPLLQFLLLQLLVTGFYIALAWAARRGRSQWSGLLLVVSTLVITIMWCVLGAGLTGTTPMLLFIVVALASMVLRDRDNIIVGVLCIAAVGVLGLLTVRGWVIAPRAEAATARSIINVVVLYSLILGFISFLGFTNARSHARAMARLAQQALSFEAQNKQLVAQSLLVQQQGVKLEHQHAELVVRSDQLQQALDEVHRSTQTLQAVQNPLVPIADGVLVMPLVGTFDNARAAQFVEALLQGIEQRRAHTVVLDVTGLPTMDSDAAQTLLQATQASRLLGTQLVLVGLTPNVAQTIVGLGLDLSSIRIERDLQSAVLILSRVSRSGRST
jgi:rsbT co-antagonist protein RsbR